MNQIEEMLCSDEEAIIIFKEALGKTIKDLEVTDNELQLLFEDGTGIALFDSGRMCCERRFMRTDDDIQYYTNSLLQGAEVRAGGTKEGRSRWDDIEESEFLLINTSKGTFTVVNYNIHNGYYGGFYLCCKRIQVR